MLFRSGGRNVFPYEVETAAGGVEGIRDGRTAAFGTPNPTTGTDDLVVVCETRETDASKRELLQRQVLTAVFEQTGARADLVLLAPPDTLEKTSSGKLRRQALRTRLARGEPLETPKADRWLLARIWASQLWEKFRR